MGMFSDKNRTIGDKYSHGLSFVKFSTDTLQAFKEHFVNKQTHW